jgi:hypothetical protein
MANEPVQVIAPARPVRLPVVDLRALPAPLHRAEARRLAAEEVRTPFELARGPLLRTLLLRLGEREHLALLTAHHIVCDGWSMGVLVREVAALYRAFTTGEPAQLPELAIQYADFALWQRQRLDEKAMESLLAAWHRQLAGAPLLLELPGARSRPVVQTSRGATLSRTLPPDLTPAIHALCREESATLFMALLAAFDAVLCLRTGVTDLVLGTDVAGRNSAETEALIGFFVNQLVLRADLSGNPAFRELLARVRSVALAAYAHQEVPFHHLVEILNVRQGLAAAPIFQVKLVLQNAPQAALTLPELALRPVDLQAPETAQLDMNLRVSEGPAGLQLSLQYSTDIYDAATMEGLLEELELVLRTAVAHPETRLSELKDLFERRAAEQRKARAREVEVGDREKLRRIRRAAGHPG